MFNIEVTFRYSAKPNESDVSQGVYSLLGDWAKNGQILDTDWLNHAVPLYRVPPTDESNSSYQDILRWQRLWKSCDQLQMACGSEERWATKQLSDPSSPLSVTGRDVCSSIEDLSGVPTFYDLYRGNGRSLAAEQRRLCPSCGKKWALPEPLHGIIDFKCDPCRLVSNIAWSVRG